MSIELVSLKCAACGASLEDFQNQTEIKCGYCNTLNKVLRPIQVIANTAKLGEADSGKLNNLIAIMEKSMVAGNYKEAYDYCNKALEIDPNSSTLWENKAICKFHLSPLSELSHSDAQEIITYLNTAKQADPDSITHQTTANSIATNLFGRVYHAYSKMAPDESSNGSVKNKWSSKAVKNIISYLNLMELCFTISPGKLYLETAVKELADAGKIKNWITQQKNEFQNAQWLKPYNYDAVKKKEQYLKMIRQIEPGYIIPVYKAPKKNNAVIAIIIVVALGIVYIVGNALNIHREANQPAQKTEVKDSVVPNKNVPDKKPAKKTSPNVTGQKINAPAK
jgi:tetratricopeptide (TPR) repeat protein